MMRGASWLVGPDTSRLELLRGPSTGESAEPSAPGDAAVRITVDVSVRGQWSTVPALKVGDARIIVNGSWLKVASVHDEQWLANEVADPKRCIQAVRRFGVAGRRPDIFTFAQKLPATTPKYPYPLEWESIAAVRLPSYATWWARVPRETRKNVRRASRRGVTVAIRQLDDDLIASIVALNNDSKIRQGVPFVHYGKTYEEVKRDQSTHNERSEFFCAYLGDELIGFLKLVYGDRSGALLQLSTKLSSRDARPANALIARAIQRCDERGLPYMVYGNYRYGNQPPTSLMEFKRRNGFDEMLVPRFYVPLTARGAIAIRLRLHRDRVSTLPRVAIGVGRQLRAAWYRLRTVHDGP